MSATFERSLKTAALLVEPDGVTCVEDVPARACRDVAVIDLLEQRFRDHRYSVTSPGGAGGLWRGKRRMGGGLGSKVGRGFFGFPPPSGGAGVPPLPIRGLF